MWGSVTEWELAFWGTLGGHSREQGYLDSSF